MAAANKHVIPQFPWPRNPGAGYLGLSQACSQDFGQSYLHFKAQMGQDLFLRLFAWKLASYRRTRPKFICEAHVRPQPPPGQLLHNAVSQHDCWLPQSELSQERVRENAQQEIHDLFIA